MTEAMKITLSTQPADARWGGFLRDFKQNRII